MTEIDTRAFAATVSVVEPMLPLAFALMTVVPCASEVARPPSEIVAFAGDADDQMIHAVRSLVVLLV